MLDAVSQISWTTTTPKLFHGSHVKGGCPDAALLYFLKASSILLCYFWLRTSIIPCSCLNDVICSLMKSYFIVTNLDEPDLYDFIHHWWIVQFSSVQSLSRVQLFATPWITACQASLSITKSRSSLRLTSIESVMLSSHLILRRPLLLLPPITPSIRVFSSESTLHMRWPKY